MSESRDLQRTWNAKRRANRNELHYPTNSNSEHSVAAPLLRGTAGIQGPPGGERRGTIFPERRRIQERPWLTKRQCTRRSSHDRRPYHHNEAELRRRYDAI